MQKTPKGFRLHIGIFGRRNVGKSSLLNALTQQKVAIVSEIAGTTTDPIEKPMELLPVGPVLFIDTAGIDDEGLLGQKRIEQTRKIFDRTDLAILVITANNWNQFEEELIAEFQRRAIPMIVVMNKIDLLEPDGKLVEKLAGLNLPLVKTVATDNRGILDLKEAIIKQTPADIINNPVIVGDLIYPGDLIVLVVPIDKEAPKGRLILPQVQTIRDILDNGACNLVVRERELKHAFKKLKTKPAMVITDSQVFQQVAAETPDDVRLTSFSILFARLKGNLNEFVRGTIVVDSLKTGDQVLIAEACTHHPIEDDIATVKIPRWLNQYTRSKISFNYCRGHDFPADLEKYKLIILCGSCMFNRREVLSRIMHAQRVGVPITNYGLIIACSRGIFERALSPFPEAMSLYRKLRGKGISKR